MHHSYKFLFHLVANSGITILNFDDQIVGGKKATRGQFPWQTLLTLDGSYMCGGSLISPNWILTAAHCSHEYNKSTLIDKTNLTEDAGLQISP